MAVRTNRQMVVQRHLHMIQNPNSRLGCKSTVSPVLGYQAIYAGLTEIQSFTT
jgi:hypothetical protein